MAGLVIGAGLAVIVLAVIAWILYRLGFFEVEVGRAKEKDWLPASWPADLFWVAVERYRTDPVEAALSASISTWDRRDQYRRAKTEIVTAFDASRLPAQWAQDTVRAYREAFAAVAELDAARLREETARLRQAATPKQPTRDWHAEVVRPRPKRPQLPN